MSATQLRLLPDPQPLVERLGRGFFNQVPEMPGVYLMKDQSEAVIYVGKAKNLRKRLSCYRVANPERMARRVIRLVHHVRRIDYEICECETSALKRESKLLRTLRPRFNRAGVWPSQPQFLLWRRKQDNLEITLSNQPSKDWENTGELRGAKYVLCPLVRLIWFGLQPEPSLAEMPLGWFHGRLPEKILIKLSATRVEFPASFAELMAENPKPFLEWITGSISAISPGWQRTTLAEDLESVVSYFSNRSGREWPGS